MSIFKKSDNYGFEEDDKMFKAGGFDEMDEMEGDGFGLDDVAPTAPEDVPAFAPAAPALKIVNPKEYKDAIEIANLLMNGNTILLVMTSDDAHDIVVKNFNGLWK